MILHHKILDKSKLTKTWEDFQYKIQHSYVENHGFIVFLDINNMKMVNDTYGHMSGDRVIKRIAYLLAKGTRDEDRIVRFGGDEFILFIPALNKNQIETMLISLQKSVEEDKYLRIRYDKVSLSIGVATLTKNDKKTMKEIIEEADVLMYAAKCNAPSYMVFDDDENICKIARENRQLDKKSLRKRSYFAWVISVILKEEKNWHSKLLMNVCRQIFNINGFKLLQLGTPDETIMRVKYAYEAEVRYLQKRKEKLQTKKALLKLEK